MKKINLFLTIGALLLATNTWSGNYARVYIHKSQASTGDGSIYVSTSSTKPGSANENATSGKADKDYAPQTFYFWADANTGSHFVGWADADNKTEVISNSSDQPYSEQFNAAGGAGTSDKFADYNRYAVFAANTYTIEFDKNDQNATGSTASVDATYDQDATLTANGFTLDGYNFDGWNTQADGSGTAYGDGDNVSNLTSTHEATVTLYAQWSLGAVDPNIVQNITTFYPNKLYNDVITSKNETTTLTLSIANANPSDVAEFLPGNVLRVYKEGYFDIVANQPAVAGVFNAVVDKVVASCTVFAPAAWTWEGENPAADVFYIYNPTHNVFLAAGSTISNEPTTSFTLSAATGCTIAVNGLENTYVYESKGTASWGATNSNKWSIEANNGGYYIYHKDPGVLISAPNRYINYDGSNISYSKDNFEDDDRTWLFLSEAQVKAYLAYQALYAFAETQTGNARNELIEVLSAHDNDAQTGSYASHVSPLQGANPLFAHISNAGWASACFAYDVEVPAGVTAYKATSLAGGYVHLEVITGGILAGTGFIYSGSEGDIYFGVSTSAAAVEGNIFLGTTTATNFTANTIYILSGVNEGKPVFSFFGADENDTDNHELAAGKAYINVPAGAPARLEAIIGGNEPIATDIENVTVQNIKKALINGKIVILRGNQMFDLNGMLVK